MARGIDEDGNPARITDHSESYRKILNAAHIEKGTTDKDKSDRRQMVIKAWEEYADRSLSSKDVKMIFNALQSKRKGFRLTKDGFLHFSNKMVQDDGKIQTDDFEIKTTEPRAITDKNDDSDLERLQNYITREMKRREEIRNG